MTPFGPAQVAKRQTGLVLRRRYSFLQLLLDSVGAHHAALRSGSEMLGRLTPLGDAARGVVAEAKEAEKEVQVGRRVGWRVTAERQSGKQK